TRVEVELNEGTVHSIAVEMPVGSLAAPLSAGQYETKFDECAAGLIPADELADLKRGIENLANLKSVAAVTGPLANGWAHHGCRALHRTRARRDPGRRARSAGPEGRRLAQGVHRSRGRADAATRGRGGDRQRPRGAGHRVH